MRGPSGLQPLGVPGDMVGHEAGDEIVAVIVSRSQVQRQRDIRLAARRFEQFGLQLFFQELVCRALIHQKPRGAGAILDQRACVVFAPRRTVIPQIAGERLLPPGAVQRAGDGRKGADGARR